MTISQLHTTKGVRASYARGYNDIKYWPFIQIIMLPSVVRFSVASVLFFSFSLLLYFLCSARDIFLEILRVKNKKIHGEGNVNSADVISSSISCI